MSTPAVYRFLPFTRRGLVAELRDSTAAAEGELPQRGVTACPADGSAVERRRDVVEAAVERALTQAAAVHVLRDRPELASHGHVAAVLRF